MRGIARTREAEAVGLVIGDYCRDTNNPVPVLPPLTTRFRVLASLPFTAVVSFFHWLFDPSPGFVLY